MMLAVSAANPHTFIFRKGSPLVSISAPMKADVDGVILKLIFIHLHFMHI